MGPRVGTTAVGNTLMTGVAVAGTAVPMTSCPDSRGGRVTAREMGVLIMRSACSLFLSVYVASGEERLHRVTSAPGMLGSGLPNFVAPNLPGLPIIQRDQSVSEGPRQLSLSSGDGSGLLPRAALRGRFLLSSAHTKRPKSTHPFIPGSQGTLLTRVHFPSRSCGHPQELMRFLLSSIRMRYLMTEMTPEFERHDRCS